VKASTLIVLITFAHCTAYLPCFVQTTWILKAAIENCALAQADAAAFD